MRTNLIVLPDQIIDHSGYIPKTSEYPPDTLLCLVRNYDNKQLLCWFHVPQDAGLLRWEDFIPCNIPADYEQRVQSYLLLKGT